MSFADQQYAGIAWKAGGRSRHTGVDCAGLAWLWLTENTGFVAPRPESSVQRLNGGRPPKWKMRSEWERGDAVFFRHRPSGELRHVAIFLGRNQFLHILQGCASRIDTGTTLIERLKFDCAGALGPDEAAVIAMALALPNLGWAVVVELVVAIVLSAVSYALSPSAQAFKRQNGKYSDQGLLTQKSPEVPLPDLLGSVVVAGNAIYQQLADRGATATASAQTWNQIIVLCGGPANLIDYASTLQIKGTSYLDSYWKNGANVDGIIVNPAQTKAEAVTGTIAGTSTVPTISLYDGAFGISVPVDVRASYDRDFPIYGLSGCAYMVLRAIDATKFGNFNVTIRVQGRKCRTFDTSGFIRTTVTSEATGTGDGSTVRFKLGHEDIIAVTALTVGGTGYTEMDATHQSGNVFAVNKTKGYVEFPAAPAGAAAIVVSYTYFPRAWTQNPASHLVYLLTEVIKGKGFDESRIDWASAADLRDYCDGSVTWAGANTTTTGARFVCNYAVDDRKAIQDHLKAVLDACNGLLFFSQGRFFLKARKADDASVFAFDDTSIVQEENGDSSFEATLLDRSARVNRVKLLYHSDEALQAETEYILDDQNDQASRAPRVGNQGIVDDNLKFPAVTTADQAERLAWMILAEQVGQRWQYHWKTNIKCLALQPGDLVGVTHASVTGGSLTVRLEQLEYDDLDRLVLTGSEFVPSAYV